MAKFDGKFLKGALGPVVFRVVNGKQIVSSKPHKVKQTAETKKAGSTFGEGSSLSRQIRANFAEGILNLHDQNLHDRLLSRLNVIVNQCRDKKTMKYHFNENSFNSLINFDFNIHSPLKKQLPSEPAIVIENQTLTVAFPKSEHPAKLKFIKGGYDCELKILVRFYRLKDGLKTRYNAEQTILVEKYGNNDLSGKEFPFAIPNGCLCIVSMFLHYSGEFGIINSKQINPGAICYAGETQGIFEENASFLWSRMDKSFE